MRCPRCNRKTDRPKREDCRVCLDCSIEMNDHIAWLVGILVLKAPFAREDDIQDILDSLDRYVNDNRRHIDLSVLNAVRWWFWVNGTIPEALVL